MNKDIALSRTDLVNKSEYSKINHQLLYPLNDVVNIDFINGSSATIDLTSQIIGFSFIFENMKEGESYILIVKMGDTAVTATYPDDTLFEGGDSSIILSTDGNSTDVLTLFYDGTNVYIASVKGWS